MAKYDVPNGTSLSGSSKTVIQEMIYFAGRMIVTGRRLKLRFSRHVTAHAEAFAGIYDRLAYG
jgi:hypothetical protein